MSAAAYHDRNRLEIFRIPSIAKPFAELATAILGPGKVSNQLKGEVFTVVSLSAGCRHCQAHGSYGLHRSGVSTERIQALWDFERSAHFSAADRAALSLARDAGVVPNAVTADHYEELRRHFSDDQIAELLAVIAMSGFLNRYSDTLAVVTDEESAEWAAKYLASLGWRIGKHAGAASEQRKHAPRRGESPESMIADFDAKD